MALDATPAGANANSYLTVAEADAYFTARLHSDVWTAASAEDKEAALIMATRVLDTNVCYVGAASTSTQALVWPRTGLLDRNGISIAATVIPRSLKDATAELAMLLISKDRTLESSAEAEGLSSLSVGPISMSFKDKVADGLGTLLTTIQRNGIVGDVIPAGVLSLLVPSWICRDASKRPMFEVL